MSSTRKRNRNDEDHRGDDIGEETRAPPGDDYHNALHMGLGGERGDDPSNEEEGHQDQSHQQHKRYRASSTTSRPQPQFQIVHSDRKVSSASNNGDSKRASSSSSSLPSSVEGQFVLARPSSSTLSSTHEEGTIDKRLDKENNIVDIKQAEQVRINNDGLTPAQIMELRLMTENLSLRPYPPFIELVRIENWDALVDVFVSMLQQRFPNLNPVSYKPHLAHIIRVLNDIDRQSLNMLIEGPPGSLKTTITYFSFMKRFIQVVRRKSEAEKKGESPQNIVLNMIYLNGNMIQNHMLLHTCSIESLLCTAFYINDSTLTIQNLEGFIVPVIIERLQQIDTIVIDDIHLIPKFKLVLLIDFIQNVRKALTKRAVRYIATYSKEQSGINPHSADGFLSHSTLQKIFSHNIYSILPSPSSSLVINNLSTSALGYFYYDDTIDFNHVAFNNTIHAGSTSSKYFSASYSIPSPSTLRLSTNTLSPMLCISSIQSGLLKALYILSSIRGEVAHLHERMIYSCVCVLETTLFRRLAPMLWSQVLITQFPNMINGRESINSSSSSSSSSSSTHASLSSSSSSMIRTNTLSNLISSQHSKWSQSQQTSQSNRTRAEDDPGMGRRHASRISSISTRMDSKEQLVNDNPGDNGNIDDDDDEVPPTQERINSSSISSSSISRPQEVVDISETITATKSHRSKKEKRLQALEEQQATKFLNFFFNRPPPMGTETTNEDRMKRQSLFDWWGNTPQHQRSTIHWCRYWTEWTTHVNHYYPTLLQKHQDQLDSTRKLEFTNHITLPIVIITAQQIESDYINMMCMERNTDSRDAKHWNIPQEIDDIASEDGPDKKEAKIQFNLRQTLAINKPWFPEYHEFHVGMQIMFVDAFQTGDKKYAKYIQYQYGDIGTIVAIEGLYTYTIDKWYFDHGSHPPCWRTKRIQVRPVKHPYYNPLIGEVSGSQGTTGLLNIIRYPFVPCYSIPAEFYKHVRAPCIVLFETALSLQTHSVGDHPIKKIMATKIKTDKSYPEYQALLLLLRDRPWWPAGSLLSIAMSKYQHTEMCLVGDDIHFMRLFCQGLNPEARPQEIQHSI